MTLYKYLDPARAGDLLQKRLIRFTQPDAFNDPFDSRPCFDSVIEREIVEQVCQLDDPEETKKWQAQITELLQGPELRDWYAAGTLSKIGILCLAEQSDNILMWAHYARSHQGFVVGFDAEHPSLRNRADGESRNLQRVPFHPQAVREVILGARMRQSSVKLIVEALSDPDYRHVQLKRAEVDRDR